MNRQPMLAFAIVPMLAMLAFASPPAVAVEPPSVTFGAVTAVGTATAAYRPETLRIKVLLTADGKDAPAAVAALAAKRDAVRKALTDAGIPADNISFSPTTTGGPAMTPQQRQMAMIMAMQHNGAHPPSTQPAPVSVSTTLTANASLPATGTDDDLLIAAVGIEDKTKSALKSALQNPALTPEQVEVAEEQAGSNQDQSMSPSPKPGEPDFTFVHKLHPDERAKLIADALAQARAQATRLAKAANGTLGPIQDLTTKAGPAAESDNPMAQIIAAEIGGDTSKPASPDEATDPQPASLSYNVQVTVKFTMFNSRD